MSTIDDRLQELSNTVYQHGKATRTNTPFHHGEPMSEAKQAIKADILELIEPIAHKIHPNSTKFIDLETLKQALNEYFK